MKKRPVLLSLREHPELAGETIACLKRSWPDVPGIVYEDSVRHGFGPGPLPRWYLLRLDGETVGCAGLIANDFISRQDLLPWLCALHIDEPHRGNGYGRLLIEKAMRDTAENGFDRLYLSTEHVGYYEKYGFDHLGTGYYPWDEATRIYGIDVRELRTSPFTIRPEKETDFEKLYGLIREAFRSARVSDGSEQDFAARLRAGEGYLPELALVAEKEGHPIGHVMLTKTHVRRDGGGTFDALLAAPLSVVPEEQGKGVGTALMREALRKAGSLGYQAVFLCGDPQYYHRFGYVRTSEYGIRPSTGIPDRYSLVRELETGVLNPVSGELDCF